ncbi:MAG: hypothetical protein K6C94_08110 [Candidatus Gastranaerophilales bacterium]|nr:hypothetical protein [Candidatus Gastranaerophilales bacterium]
MDNIDNKKVVNIKLKSGKINSAKSKSEIKNFNGFDYIKSDKDLNGVPFIKENLIEYSQGCKYMVRVMREKKNKVYLYNYYVSQEALANFLIKFENGEFGGQIIEVEKYIPEELA